MRAYIHYVYACLFLYFLSYMIDIPCMMFFRFLFLCFYWVLFFLKGTLIICNFVNFICNIWKIIYIFIFELFIKQIIKNVYIIIPFYP